MATPRAKPAGAATTAEFRGQIKAAARAQGISQIKLAGLVGISDKHMSQLLLGRLDGRLGLWMKIAAALGYKLDLMAADFPEGESD